VQRDLEALSSSQLYRFADWPNEAVPAVAAGAYTVWEGDDLVYAGMAGRSLTADSILEHRSDPTRVTGLRSRLASHASGRRSGDQFCVYVADRFVLPELDPETIKAVAKGRVSFDDLVRAYIRGKLAYRFIETVDGGRSAAIATRSRRSPADFAGVGSGPGVGAATGPARDPSPRLGGRRAS
jgi:hypothetical protein